MDSLKLAIKSINMGRLVKSQNAVYLVETYCLCTSSLTIPSATRKISGHWLRNTFPIFRKVVSGECSIFFPTKRWKFAPACGKPIPSKTLNNTLAKSLVMQAAKLVSRSTKPLPLGWRTDLKNGQPLGFVFFCL